MIRELFEQIAKKFPEKENIELESLKIPCTVFIKANASSLNELPVVFALCIANFLANVAICIA